MHYMYSYANMCNRSAVHFVSINFRGNNFYSLFMSKFHWFPQCFTIASLRINYFHIDSRLAASDDIYRFSLKRVYLQDTKTMAWWKILSKTERLWSVFCSLVLRKLTSALLKHFVQKWSKTETKQKWEDSMRNYYCAQKSLPWLRSKIWKTQPTTTKGSRAPLKYTKPYELLSVENIVSPAV